MDEPKRLYVNMFSAGVAIGRADARLSFGIVPPGAEDKAEEPVVELVMTTTTLRILHEKLGLLLKAYDEKRGATVKSTFPLPVPPKEVPN